MYPSLTSVASSSRWYSKKQSAKDKLTEITQMEEILSEKRSKSVKVGAIILIRGKPSNQEETAISDDDNAIYNNETSNDLFDTQYEQDIPESHNDYSHYDPYSSPS